MQIYIRVKAAGKRRDVLEKIPFFIPDGINRAEALVTHIITENVRAYNRKAVDAPLFKYLTEKELEAGENIGKIGFGDRKNEKQQDEEEAVKNAIECFKDGIYRILINETEAEAGREISINENDTITFIRLVMLAGRRW
ncbi:hypothetical protein FACS1894151_09560 [Spirochaetia bacterium]|nr:hypothetical protein FACS1894151_09560 [Spirochaetia bacterium]